VTSACLCGARSGFVNGQRCTPCAGVATDSGDFAADVVVLAAGCAVQELAAQAGADVPLLHRPAVSAETNRLPRIANRLLATPSVFAFQRPDGSFILGDSTAHEDGSAEYGQSLLKRATALLPALASAGARIERVTVAYRPWPKVRRVAVPLPVSSLAHAQNRLFETRWL
jgi:glycine/D-amino acid oxidase-like deaminating enzyme